MLWEQVPIQGLSSHSGDGRGGEGREGGREGGEGRGGEGRGWEGLLIHNIMAPQYLNNNHVTYYVIT